MNLTPINPNRNEPPNGGIRVLILQRPHAQMLKRLIEHEVMASCCFDSEFDRIDIKRELLEVLEVFDGD